MSEIWLQNLTWEEFQEALERAKVVIIPVGSVEQHGPHLPLGTDTLVATALAEDAAKEADAIVTPPIWYGWSPHHMALPGTVTLRAEILVEMLYDVISSLTRHGAHRFVILNGHRIVNIPWMQIACNRAQNDFGVKTVIFDPAYMSKSIVDGLGFGPLGHAEEIESSHMWYRYPHMYKADRVHDYPQEQTQDRSQDHHQGRSQEHAQDRSQEHPQENSQEHPQEHSHAQTRGADLLYSVDPRFQGDTLCYVPTSLAKAKEVSPVSKGVSGRPSASSPEKGKVYHEHLVHRLVEVIYYLREMKDK